MYLQGTPQPQSAPAPVVAPPAAGDDEAAAIAAMFSETSEQWEQTQEKMAQFVSILRPLCRLVVVIFLNNSSFVSFSCTSDHGPSIIALS